MALKLDKSKLNKNYLNKFSIIIFDLDNTLFKELDYLKFAYSDIAKKIVQRYNSLKKSEITNFLVKSFEIYGRSNLYQRLIQQFKIDFTLDEFLTSLRNVKIPQDSIKINPLIKNFIINNIDKFKFCIATNGNPIQQKNKIKSIALPFKENFYILYCDLLGEDKKKPSPVFISNILNKFKNLKKENTIRW